MRRLKLPKPHQLVLVVGVLVAEHVRVTAHHLVADADDHVVDAEARALAFALPHVQPWAVLGTFLVGCGLGSVERHSRRLGLCIGIHAGLNAAASFWGAAGAGRGVALASGLAFWALVLKGGRDDVR